DLSVEEKAAIQRPPFPLAITPYYASLMDRQDSNDPLRRTHIPVMGEYRVLPGEADDPLCEEQNTVVPGVVHRYPDRVLFLVTGVCATYCRYCSRSRMIGDQAQLARSWDTAIDYIAMHPEIRDVLVSGGDPLRLANGLLDSLLRRLRAIPHVEFLRIGSKIPLVLPMRITAKLVKILKKYHPLAMSIHATHPKELTLEANQALSRLADAGIMLGSQTVLLRGINDNLETIRPLMHGLLKNRVKPYYLYQCDPIRGSGHFRTPVETGMSIIAGLRGHTSGYAVPDYVIDAPGGGGKIPLAANGMVGREAGMVLLKNYQAEIYRYPDPVE
ncbi:MAG: KamA family radical SAM protein, partial [Magnetococcales bacterium]|nr:KamA family radical SAM protein [Magnetococcales bacterium]